MRRRPSTALGGLPIAAAAATRGRVGRSTLQQATPRTSRDELEQLLRRKAWQLKDVNRNPVVLGVPIGQDGGETKGVSVDCGLKSMATVSLADLVDSSPDLKEALIERGLENPTDTEPLPHNDLLRQAKPVPMVVAVPEDLMRQPVANPVHPAALARDVPDEKLAMLADAFFRNIPPSAEVVNLVVEAVPHADKHVQAREDFRREQRALLQASGDRGGGRRS